MLLVLPEQIFTKLEIMERTIGYIGLGKMGKAMVTRLLEKSWSVVAYNHSPESVTEVVALGATGANSIAECVAALPTPRLVWLMVPHSAVDEVLTVLTPLLSPGDTVVDGGNCPYSESRARAATLKSQGVNFLDIGVSGGPSGARHGACMMVGGEREIFTKLEQTGFFADTCVESGYAYLGDSGAGHYAKMVHNGIEYGMMQSIAEGFDLLHRTPEFHFDLRQVAALYSHGSVITSRLVDWLESGYAKHGSDLESISGSAAASGEGQWTVDTGKRAGVAMPAIQAALDLRSASQEHPSYQGQVISTLRNEFGGHSAEK